MAYAMYPTLQPSSSWNSESMQAFQASNIANAAIQDDATNDPVRLARNEWNIQHAHVSDSSAIIDSIDVDMIDATQDGSEIEVYIVLDTNVLIRWLVILKQALARIESPGAELNVVLLVPGIVVSELDYQKNSKREIAAESRRASDWLAGEIGNGKGRVKGQAYSQTMLHTGDWRQRCGLTNDELILDCCKYFGHMKHKDVLLCTSDNNLAVQAAANAGNLFFRDVSAVVRPPRERWDAAQLLERAVPGSGDLLEASMHASAIVGRRSYAQNNSRSYQRYVEKTPYPPPPPPPALPQSSARDQDGFMEIDMECGPPSLPRSTGDRRDLLHRHMGAKLSQHLRKLTGQAASLQQHRQQHESMYSPANAKFKGQLPREHEWNQAWTLRECLRFVAKVPPPRPRSWTFEEGEASSLADFLGIPGEKGARPGREWSKHDWGRELLTVRRLGQDFQIRELAEDRMAEYEHDVMEAFAVE